MSENKKDLLAILRKFVGTETKLKADEVVKLATETLDNGTVIEADSFEAGQNVAIVAAEDGDASIPLPAEEYLMADGRILVVIEDGIIDSIKEAEAEKPEENPELKAETVSLEMFNELKSMVEKLVEVKTTELEAEEVDELQALKDANVKLAAELAEKADAPTIKAVPVELNAVAPVGIKEKIAAKLAQNRS